MNNGVQPHSVSLARVASAAARVLGEAWREAA